MHSRHRTLALSALAAFALGSSLPFTSDTRRRHHLFINRPPRHLPSFYTRGTGACGGSRKSHRNRPGNRKPKR